MSSPTHDVMMLASDLSLIVLLSLLTMLASYAWSVRSRNGVVVRRMAEFLLALALFFSWSALVEWDRRWNVWPWASLSEVMAGGWQWIPQSLLVVPTAALLATLIRTRR
jgi:hypothetical protein